MDTEARVEAGMRGDGNDSPKNGGGGGGPDKGPGGSPRESIVIRLRSLSQLFASLDPSPFREGELTTDAEEYLIRKVSELPDGPPLRIVIQLPAADAMPRPSSDVAAALTGHFACCAAIEAKKAREALRAWRQMAAIGFVVLATCLFLAWHITNTLPPRPVTRIFQESFVILGWVAMWKPIETLLYDLLPPARHRRRHVLQRLSNAEVVVARSA